LGGDRLKRDADIRMAKFREISWSFQRKILVKKLSASQNREPIDPDWLALQVVEMMPPNGILVDEGLISSRYIPFLHAHRDRYG
jgi:benzoylformate decarboxylase